MCASKYYLHLVKSFGAWRHGIYCTTEEASSCAPLVSSCDCSCVRIYCLSFAVFHNLITNYRLETVLVHSYFSSRYVWYVGSTGAAAAMIFQLLNYVVHAFMYTYYALRAMKYRVPRAVSIVLTLMQISQMFVGFGLNYYTLYLKETTMPSKLKNHPSYIIIFHAIPQIRHLGLLY